MEKQTFIFPHPEGRTPITLKGYYATPRNFPKEKMWVKLAKLKIVHPSFAFLETNGNLENVGKSDSM